MKNVLAENTKVASYLLWERTKYNNALDLWYCSEDIAFYLETNDIITMDALKEILERSKYDYIYIDFFRNVSYRIYSSTKNSDHLCNWYIVEELFSDKEWCKAIVTMAYLLRVIREGKVDMSVRSDRIKRDLANS